MHHIDIYTSITTNMPRYFAILKGCNKLAVKCIAVCDSEGELLQRLKSKASFDPVEAKVDEESEEYMPPDLSDSYTVDQYELAPAEWAKLYGTKNVTCNCAANSDLYIVCSRKTCDDLPKIIGAVEELVC